MNRFWGYIFQPTAIISSLCIVIEDLLLLFDSSVLLFGTELL